jgi:hypothetical protein
MQDSLDKRSRKYASTPILGRQKEIWLSSGRDRNVAMWAKTPVPAHASFASIEHWGVTRVLSVESPVHVLKPSIPFNHNWFGGHTGWYPLYPHSLRNVCSYAQVKYRCHVRKLPFSKTQRNRWQKGRGTKVLIKRITYSKMDGQGLLYMYTNKIVISSPCARDLLRV